MISADLGKPLEGYVAQLVESGRYGSKSEVLREGVRLVQEREMRLVALDTSITRGLADADAGRTKPAIEVFDRLAAKYQKIDDADVNTVTHSDEPNVVVMRQDYYNSLIETLHLMSSPENAVHVAKSIAEYRDAQAVRRDLDTAE